MPCCPTTPTDGLALCITVVAGCCGASLPGPRLWGSRSSGRVPSVSMVKVRCNTLDESCVLNSSFRLAGTPLICSVISFLISPISPCSSSAWIWCFSCSAFVMVVLQEARTETLWDKMASSYSCSSGSRTRTFVIGSP